MKKKLILAGNTEEFNLERIGPDSVEIQYQDSKVSAHKVISGESTQFDVININGRNQRVKRVGDFISIDGKNYKVESAMAALSKKSGAEGNMTSPMPGKILKVMVSAGEKVTSGQGLLVMEAMKMDHTIKAPQDGVVSAVHYKEGDLVDGGVELLEMEANESSED